MINKLFYNQNPLNFWYILVIGIWGFIIALIVNHNSITFNFSFSPVLFKNISLNASIALVFVYFTILFSAFLMMSISKEFSDSIGLLLPSTVFVLLINLLTPTILDFTAVLTVPFFLMIMKILISTYEKQKAFENIIYLGLLSAIISIIKIEFVIILFLCFMGISILRPFSGKEYILLLISYFFPFVLIDALMYFFSDKHIFALLNVHYDLQHFNYTQLWSSIYPLMVLLILSAFVIFKFVNKKVELKKIRTRRFFLWVQLSLVIVWLILLGLLFPSLYYVVIVLIALSFSVVLISIKTKRHAVLWLLALIILNFLVLVVL